MPDTILRFGGGPIPLDFRLIDNEDGTYSWRIWNEDGIPPLIPGLKAKIVTPSHWQLEHSPAANTQATITHPAQGTGRHIVCTAINFTLAAGLIAPAAVSLLCEALDGATRIWSARLALQALAGSVAVAAPPLILLGSANTAMTLRFDGAGGLNTFEAVAAQGYGVRV